MNASLPESLPQVLQIEELLALRRALERARGFTLYLVRANTPQLRAELAAWLRQSIARPWVEIHLQPDGPLYEQLHHAAHDAAPDAILSVYGLETLHSAQDPDWLVRQLNWRRSVYRRLARPLLLWLPEYLLRRLQECAPDFMDWHSGLYEFSTVASALERLHAEAFETGSKGLQAGTPSERWERIVQLRGLLEEYADADTPEAQAARLRALRALGDTYREIGDFENARATYQQALALSAALYGPEHPEVATTINNLGLVMQDLGDLAGARAAFERALRIDEAVYGPEHPGVATTVNNLGSVLQDLGDSAGARAAYERALRIWQQV